MPEGIKLDLENIAYGGFWKIQAVRLVKEYLEENLKESENAFVLS